MQYVTKNQFRTRTKEEREQCVAELAEKMMKEYFRKGEENDSGGSVLSTFGRGQKQKNCKG